MGSKPLFHTFKRPLLLRPRNWIANRLYWIATALFVDEDQFLPLCPDCNAAPDYGPDSECHVCAFRQEHDAREADAYEAGRESAYESLRGLE